MDVSEMNRKFIALYKGMFGDFSAEESSDMSASASSPDGDNMSVIRFDMAEDPAAEFENKKAFIRSKGKRLGPMGELKVFEHPCGFDGSFGAIMNFDLRGVSGGFFFYTAYKGNVVLFIQAYSTTGKGQISDAERDGIIDTAFKTIST